MSCCRALYVVVLLTVGGGMCAAQTTVTNLFENLNKVIPDGQLTGVSDTQFLTFAEPGMDSITDLKVILNIAGGFNGDFYGYLVHDDGFAVLLNRVGRTTSSPFGYSDGGMAITLSAGGEDIHSYQSHFPTFEGGQLTGDWGPDGRDFDPQRVLDTDEQTDLLGSFDGSNPSGAWTLFLADLDFGQQGTLVNWGVVITAVPEPSTWSLAALGAALAVRFLRRRSRS